MKDGPDIARIATLIGDPARANMLVELMGGKALTAGELSRVAGVTQQTASSHLTKLVDGGLLQTVKQGRHKYFALASDEVAGVLEALMGVAAKSGHFRTRTGPRDAALRKARVCYNHLAGDMGTRLYDGLMAQGHLCKTDDGPILTDTGAALMRDFGIDLDALSRKRAPLCRDCLDWSERRAHLAGSLGRALLTRMEELDWLTRSAGSRVLTFSDKGETAFAATFES
ncbi:helix-turn-helix domain-containing protein [Epibacterium sp. SM1979]|uniref:Helix-turn-helix domain-containing protein n=1 Tax=Tritonibacter litoralis TaxID=2662264 RepID=A0A843YI39_9RHOB|nr:winged helix-turn-helix domain-containing protein [Tritonibacter litoralis]MQQ08932.1 helix-turn-helix domain-containing protein [Tritonibacter litoralis]